MNSNQFETHNQDTEFQSKTIDMMPTQVDVVAGHLKNRVIIRPNHNRLIVNNNLASTNKMLAWEMEKINEEDDPEEPHNWLNNSMNSIVRLNENLYNNEEIKESASLVFPDNLADPFGLGHNRSLKKQSTLQILNPKIIWWSEFNSSEAIHDFSNSKNTKARQVLGRNKI